MTTTLCTICCMVRTEDIYEAVFIDPDGNPLCADHAMSTVSMGAYFDGDLKEASRSLGRINPLIMAYAENEGLDNPAPELDTILSDMIADILLWGALVGIDGDNIVGRAFIHYEEETQVVEGLAGLRFSPPSDYSLNKIDMIIGQMQAAFSQEPA